MTYQNTTYCPNLSLACSPNAIFGDTQSAENEQKLRLDYYVFGMPMHSRTFTGNGYKFGFNGQEKEDDIYGEGNAYSAEYWMYDSRLGRRWNVDPVDQISISNYAVFTNNPIANVDPDGAWVRGAGFWRNITKSDQRIEAEDFAEANPGSIIRKEKRGWSVRYNTQIDQSIAEKWNPTTTETPTIKYFNKPKPKIKIISKSEINVTFGPQAEFGIKTNTRKSLGIDLTIVNFNILKMTITETVDLNSGENNSDLSFNWFSGDVENSIGVKTPVGSYSVKNKFKLDSDLEYMSGTQQTEYSNGQVTYTEKSTGETTINVGAKTTASLKFILGVNYSSGQTIEAEKKY